MCGVCKRRPFRDGGRTCEPCYLAHQASQKAKRRVQTSSSPGDGDVQEQDEPMVNASEDDSDWEDHDEPMEETQESNGQELLDTPFGDFDRMAID